MQSEKKKSQDALNSYADDLVMLGLNDIDDLEPSYVRGVISRILDLIFSRSEQRDKSERKYFTEEFERRSASAFADIINELLEHRRQIIEEAKKDNYEELVA